MEDVQKFFIQFEDGIEREAELITITIIDDKDYAIYSVKDDDGMVNIVASYIVRDENGYDVLKDIDNEDDKKKISDFVMEVAGEM